MSAISLVSRAVGVHRKVRSICCVAHRRLAESGRVEQLIPTMSRMSVNSDSMDARSRRPLARTGEAPMFDVNHLSRRASLEVKHHFDGPYFCGPNRRKGPASGVEFSVAPVGHEPEGEIRLLHQHPLRVSHGEAVVGGGPRIVSPTAPAAGIKRALCQRGSCRLELNSPDVARYDAIPPLQATARGASLRRYVAHHRHGALG
jgi:hypothetical protein